MYLDNQMKMFLQMDLPKIMDHEGLVLLDKIEDESEKMKLYIKWKETGE